MSPINIIAAVISDVNVNSTSTLFLHQGDQRKPVAAVPKGRTYMHMCGSNILPFF